MPVYGLDHVFVAVPVGSAARERDFFVEVLGLTEVERPESLSSREGHWLVGGALNLHVGVDPDFSPATRAHPALLVHDLDEMLARCERAGCRVDPDPEIPGYRRAHTYDPFGNRIELMERHPTPDGATHP